MAPGFLPVSNKRKRQMAEVKEEEEEEKEIMLHLAIRQAEDIDMEKEIMLHLAIRQAEDIDMETKDPAGDKRLYSVHGWVDPNYRFRTKAVEGLPNPRWNERYSIPLGISPEHSYLYLEIYRTGSKSDPGTSHGNVLVGRTRIPLPKGLNSRKGGRFGLVVPEGTGCTPEGHIILTMEMRYQED